MKLGPHASDTSRANMLEDFVAFTIGLGKPTENIPNSFGQLADGQTADTVVANETNRIESETDDGFESSNAPSPVNEDSQDQSQEPFESSPLNEGPDFGDDDHGQSLEPVSQNDVVTEMSGETIPAKNPFEGLGKLPLDIVEAVDPLKLCILRYRANDWNGFSKSQMLDLIEALKGFCQ